jgi:hypothetical protein
MTDPDFQIQEMDSIVAIKILEDSFNIDVLKYDKKTIIYIIKLLNLALDSTKLELEKPE